jgi:hypothetical protein
MSFLREIFSPELTNYTVITLSRSIKVQLYKDFTFNITICGEKIFNKSKEYSKIWKYEQEGHMKYVLIQETKSPEEILSTSMKYFLITSSFSSYFLYDEDIKGIDYDNNNDVKILTSSGIISIIKNLYNHQLMIELRGFYDIKSDESISKLMSIYKHRYIPFVIEY